MESCGFQKPLNVMSDQKTSITQVRATKNRNREEVLSLRSVPNFKRMMAKAALSLKEVNSNQVMRKQIVLNANSKKRINFARSGS